MEASFADAVIVAAGASRRMGGIDKLTAPLFGRPLLAWTLSALRGATSVRRLVVVVAPDRLAELRAADWLSQTDADVELVAGGEQRSESVANGVRATDSELVLVHDGARPLVQSSLVDAVADAAARHGAAVPVVPVADSLRRLNGDRIGALVDREGLVAAQTPQAARRELLLDAFAHAAQAGHGAGALGAGGEAGTFADEAALLFARGVPVATVPGDAANIKVTRPNDLELALTLLAGRQATAERRVGFGQDSHPFGPDMGLWLGGVLIEGAPRLYGHSDGDVALHALATAILAAARLGDLGRHFPATERGTAGAASSALLTAVVERARAHGWRVESAQVSLLGARPRLGSARLDAMQTAIAGLLSVDQSAVAVVASSGNLDGTEGAGTVISASASVTLAVVAGESSAAR